MKNDSTQNNLLKVFIPALYLSIWLIYVGLCKWFGIIREVSDTNWFLAFSFLVMFFGMITKSTSWQIGNKFFLR